MNKILFIVDSISYGGAGRVVSVLCNKLSEKKYDITLLLLGKKIGEMNSYYINESVKTIYYEDLFDETKTHWHDYIKFLRKFFIHEKINICIAFLNIYSEYAIVASLFTKTKVIACERNDPHKSPVDKKYRFLRKMLYPFAKYIVCQTTEMKNYFCFLLRKKIKVIFNPINEKLPQPYIGVRENKIVMVGKLSKQKNYPLALKAFSIIAKEFPDVNLEIYGEGQERANIEKIIKELELEKQVLLMGHSDNVYNNIMHAKLFLMTSDYEGMSNALIEAMALGIPVISTDHPIGGARELIINGNNGILTKVGDYKELSLMIKKLLLDENYRKKISSNCINIRERLNIISICRQWEELL